MPLIHEVEKRYFLIKTKWYPFFRQKPKVYSRVLLGIGGNIGDVQRRFNHLFLYLRKSPFLKVIETSPLLKNPPFGYVKQNDFYNALVVIETKLQPHKLLRYLLLIEKKFGRKRSFENAPRTLDIDIIFYENLKILKPDLMIPHPDYHNRKSILIPLSYLRYFSKKVEYHDR